MKQNGQKVNSLMKKPILKVIEVSAGYGKKEIIRNISLEVQQGSILAIIGPNGAGKSTLLKVLAGFLKPRTGKICFNDQEITYYSSYARVRSGIAFFWQGGRIFPSLSVLQNLQMGAAIVKQKDYRRNLEQILDLFPKLKNMLHKRAGLLSGGERQALALSMTLISRPKVLLLDEPSAGLSPKLVQESINRIKSINDMWNITVLMVEQNVKSALHTADNAIVLKDGSLALKTGNPENLLNSDKLEQLFLGLSSLRGTLINQRRTG